MFAIPLRRAIPAAATVAVALGGVTVAAAPASAATPTTGSTISLRSLDLPSLYVRRSGFTAKLTEVVDAGAKTDASFTVRQGLAKYDAVSFESLNYPGYYLRHANFGLYLQARTSTDTNFDRDATFYLRGSLAQTPSTHSIESYNYPGYYIRHGGTGLYLQNPAKGTTAFPREATFHAEQPAVNWLASVAPAINSLSTTTSSTASTISVAWTDNDPTEAGYLMAFGPTPDRMATTASLPASAGTGTRRVWNSPALAWDTTHCFAVATVHGSAPAGWSAPKCRGTNPAPPSNVTATADATRVLVSWTNTSKTRTGFVVQRSVNGGAYADLASPSWSASSYSDTSVKTNLRYRYRVMTVDGSGTRSLPVATSEVLLRSASERYGSLPVTLATADGSAYTADLSDADLSAAGVPWNATATAIGPVVCGSYRRTAVLTHDGVTARIEIGSANPAWYGARVSGAYSASVTSSGTAPASCSVTVEWKVPV